MYFSKRLRVLAVAGLAMIALCGANSGCSPSTTSGTIEQASQEANQLKLITALPAPHVDTSGERMNLVKRLERLNTENMSGYVYLFTEQGTMIAFYPVKGKVSSLNSFLSGDQKPTYFGMMKDAQGREIQGPGWQMTESPDYDGTYGKNVEGIFFFTADTDTYVEWKGPYLFTDAPLKVAQAPVMIREIK